MRTIVSARQRLADLRETAVRRLWLVLMAVLSFNALAPTPARASEQTQAIALITHIFSVARDSAPSEAEFRDSFDMVAIARAVLGARWSSASAAERDEFLSALRQNIAANIRLRIGGKASGVDVLGARDLSNGDVLVLTRVRSEIDGIVAMDWRTRRCGANRCVVDIIVGGASVSIQRRDQYAAYLDVNGGSITDLIPIMRLPQRGPQ
jgi:ABC-type transporter MlaC component